MTTPDQAPRELTVALLGGGTVGSQVARLLRESADDLAARAGAPLRLIGVGVRNATTPRDGIDPGLLTDNLESLASSGADIVVEVLGGIEPARSLILAAMAAGSSVVTANKALLAEDGATLHAAAAQHGVDLYYEASVAGAIPLLRPLRESLAGDKVRRVLGIVNGTTNFILTKRAPTTPRFSPRLRRSDLPRPTRPPTSRATTPQQRLRFLPVSPSTPAYASRTCTARASPGSLRTISLPLATWASSSSCSPLPNSPTMRAG